MLYVWPWCIPGIILRLPVMLIVQYACDKLGCSLRPLAYLFAVYISDSGHPPQAPSTEVASTPVKTGVRSMLCIVAI